MTDADKDFRDLGIELEKEQADKIDEFRLRLDTEAAARIGRATEIINSAKPEWAKFGYDLDANPYPVRPPHIEGADGGGEELLIARKESSNTGFDFDKGDETILVSRNGVLTELRVKKG